MYSLLIASSRDYVIPTVQSMANFLGGVYDFAGGPYDFAGGGHDKIFPVVSNSPVGGHHSNSPVGGHHSNSPVGGHHSNSLGGGHHFWSRESGGGDQVVIRW